MKVSISWLKEYVPVNMKPDQLAQALTMAGLEVGAVERRYAYLDTVLVGRITQVRPHPQAEHLKLCHVHVGDRHLPIVCGAPNVEENMLAPVALPDTVLPDGTRIERSLLRGQASEGMLCSAAELGLGSDAGGIMGLDPHLPVGQGLAAALELAEAVLEVELTPNRPDCLSLLGVAREIAAIQKTSIKYPDTAIDDPDDTIAKLTSVRIEAPKHCPRYAARLLENVRIAPSPFWLQDRLLSVGLRPINNIVDVTNFVLMETGQPLHAFDFDQLDEHRIVVRTAYDGESFVTLDQKERKLAAEMLLICDGRKPVAIGGVMGGLNSEIQDNTTRVLIEGAYFSPMSIRRTSKKLGLSTEASYRFERGVDPNGTIRAINRAARLMAEVSGATIVCGVVDEHPLPQSPPRIFLGVAHTNRLLGTRLNRQEIGELLKSIEFDVKPGGDSDKLTVVPPSFRVDVTRPEDLIEDVARLYGYERIPTTFPSIPATGRRGNRQLELRNRIKSLITGFGFTETIQYSFTHKLSGERLRLAADDRRRNTIALLNPLSEDQAVMRTSLVPGLLETMRFNLSQQARNLRIFEIGKVFLDHTGNNLPEEVEMLGALWSGSRTEPSWRSREVACDFYDLKGVTEGLLNWLGIGRLRFTRLAADECTYHRPGYSAQILVEKMPIGMLAELHPQVRETYNLKQTAYVLELDLNRLFGIIPAEKTYQPTAKFPAVFRDITLIIDKAVETQTVLARVEGFREDLIEALQLFDVFEGEPIPAGQKSVSFRITYRSADCTLADEDINALHKAVTERLVKAFNATLPA
jgi:phenylalanyl-tRNA synthetase beta chain